MPQNFEVSEGMGFSRDLCGYLRNIVGYVYGPMNEEGTPLGGLPEPDLIISAYGGCVPAMKILHTMERRFPQAKVHTAELPQVGYENIRQYHLDYCVSETHRLIDWLTETTGRKLDYDRLKEVVRLSDRACELWDEIMGYRRFIPTPISAAELGVMFVMVTRQGTQVAVDFLTELRDEVKERAENGIGMIEEERNAAGQVLAHFERRALGDLQAMERETAERQVAGVKHAIEFGPVHFSVKRNLVRQAQALDMFAAAGQQVAFADDMQVERDGPGVGLEPRDRAIQAVPLVDVGHGQQLDACAVEWRGVAQSNGVNGEAVADRSRPQLAAGGALLLEMGELLAHADAAGRMAQHARAEEQFRVIAQ